MRVITVMLLLFVLFLGVIYGALAATGSDRVDMTGEIIGLCSDNANCDNGSIDSILVEGFITGASENQNVSIILNKNTTISRKNGDTLVEASINDLKPGQKIEIQFTGSMLQTYPPQANAGQIIILY